MPVTRLVVREPLLDIEQRVIGYQLVWSQHRAEVVDEVEDALNLIALLEKMHGESDATEPKFSRYIHFLHAPAVLLLQNVFAALPPANTSLVVRVEDLTDEAVYAAVKTLRKAGYGILLRGVDIKALNPKQLAISSAIEVHFNPDSFAAQARIYGMLKNSPIRMVAREVSNWEEYLACSKLGLQSFAGLFYLKPMATAVKTKALNPSQAMLVQIMELVRNNAEVFQIEEILKHDTAISYKLLRYINSAGFGLGFEIESMRHAIQVLGYNPLYRWLSVLLMTADPGAASQILMQTAIIRGRLTELLGQAYLSKADAENLFITGMFSLLDRLLGVTMEQALEKIQLPDAVHDALILRKGIYMPFLSLAEACEQSPDAPMPIAEELGIDMDKINHAHIVALAWAENLQA
ncbi:MAG: EAL and HDOD domain-containing protein [Sulfuriferula sp.]